MCEINQHLSQFLESIHDRVGFPMPEFLTVFHFRWTFLGAAAKLYRKMVVSCFHQTQINVDVQGFRTYNLRTFEFTA